MKASEEQPANYYQYGGNHYKKMRIEHWDYVLANGIPYMEAQIIKYLSRWRDKNGMEDLEKARHFLNKLIEYEKETAHESVRVPEISGKDRVQSGSVSGKDA